MKSTRKRQDAKIMNLVFCTDKKEYINSRTINEAADLQRETEISRPDPEDLALAADVYTMPLFISRLSVGLSARGWFSEVIS